MKYILLFLYCSSLLANSLLDATLYNRLNIKNHFNNHIRIGVIDQGKHADHIKGIFKILLPNAEIIFEEYSDIEKNINNLINKKVDVINMSMYGYKFDKTEYLMFKKLESLNIPIVVAAGNDGINIDKTPVYPASYDLKNLICVSNFKNKKILDKSSNYGQKVFVGIIGENIMSYYGNKITTLSGTSQSSPIMAVAVAILMQKYHDIDKVKNFIKNHSIKNKKIQTGYFKFNSLNNLN